MATSECSNRFVDSGSYEDKDPQAGGAGERAAGGERDVRVQLLQADGRDVPRRQCAGRRTRHAHTQLQAPHLHLHEVSLAAGELRRV